jgi:hypothetical protein
MELPIPPLAYHEMKSFASGRWRRVPDWSVGVSPGWGVGILPARSWRERDAPATVGKMRYVQGFSAFNLLSRSRDGAEFYGPVGE